MKVTIEPIEETTNQKIQRRLKKIRTEAKLPASHYASLLGISVESIYQLEGKDKNRNFSIDVLENIAKIYGTTLKKLIN